MHSIATGRPEPIATPPLPDAATWSISVYWNWRRAQAAKGLCVCGNPLTPEQVQAEGLCASCEAADRARIARLEQHGLL